MHIVFVSNFFNHHQEALSKELDKLTGHQYTFISTMPMTQERKRMGWGSQIAPPYVLEAFHTDSSAEHMQDLILKADVVVWGAVPHLLLQKRIEKRLLTFWYSERLYKAPCPQYRLLQKRITMYYKFGRHKNLYLLCASAYTAADFEKTHTLSGRRYKWGYFPETRYYSDIDKLISQKVPASILWTGRMIDWKHPEIPVQIARLLKEHGYSFHMTLIGNGELQDSILTLIRENSLTNEITLIDSLTPEEVRNEMEKNQIFIATSDRNEGWGAVVNEAMNSGCTVVASHAIGSVPFLIKDYVNGFIYKDGDIHALFEKVTWLLNHTEAFQKTGKEAYLTISKHWNAQNAAHRLLALSQQLLAGSNTPFSDGICSKAEIFEDDWYENKNSLFNSLS